MQTPSPVFPSSANARGNSSVARNPAPSSPAPSNAVIQMDAPAPSVVELTAPRSLTASYLPLPGEQVFRSPSVTMHIQRSVWVHGDRWIWRTHKKVALGELATRVDPQIPQLPAAAGSITVQANIDKEGYISGIKPLYGSFALLPNVSRAIRDWRYQPTYVDNKPADTQAKIEIDFHPTNARASRP